MIFRQSISLPQFGIGANSKLKLRCPNLSFCPNSELGQNFKLGHQGKILFKPGHQCHQHQICPNSELGQYPTWGTSDFNFRLAPIPNWGNVQLGAPVFQLRICPNSELGQCSIWGTSVSTSDLPQLILN